MRTPKQGRAYSFEELTQEGFEFCPYARAPQGEFDFGLPDMTGIFIPKWMRFECFDAHRRKLESMVLRSAILSYPIEPEVAKDIIAPLFWVYVHARADGLLEDEDASAVHKDLMRTVNEYSSLSEVHAYGHVIRH